MFCCIYFNTQLIVFVLYAFYYVILLYKNVFFIKKNTLIWGGELLPYLKYYTNILI